MLETLYRSDTVEQVKAAFAKLRKWFVVVALVLMVALYFMLNPAFVAGIVAFLLTRDRRYLHISWRVTKYATIFALRIMRKLPVLGHAGSLASRLGGSSTHHSMRWGGGRRAPIDASTRYSQSFSGRRDRRRSITAS